MTSISRATTPATVVSFTYDGAGRRATTTLPNGVVSTFSYDAASRLTGISYALGATSLGNLTYSFDPAGRRTQIGGSLARTNLPTALGSATYDVGNRITQFGGAALTHDNNGNLASDGTTTYIWDARDQLVSMSRTGLTAGFQYDAFGRRRAKTINGTTTSFLYDMENFVQESTGANLTHYIAGLQMDEWYGRTDATNGTVSFLLDALAGASAAAAGPASAGQGVGEPLARPLREFFEPRFGRDFSDVRIHTGARAAASAKSVLARAYTMGQDIVFGHGQYAPDNAAGRSLIAHELTHVTQQTAPGAQPALMRSPDTGLLEEPPVSMPATGGTVTSPARIEAPSSPGWESVDPQYLIFSSGEPFELPHRLRLNYLDDDGCKEGQGRWEVREGRYDEKDVCVSNSALVASSSVTMGGSASAKFDVDKGEFYYGGKGPIEATTDADNPVPKGTHDIEIPDFQHKLGSKYGDYATTWFRLGHSGDRYLHPGRVSLGCTTIKQTSEWPKIWEYLISSRKDRQSVGELEVV